MRHDYDLPPDWAGMTSDEKNQWLTQERCRRQAQRQQTGYAKRMEEKAERNKRKRAASPAHVKLEECR